jgi:putative ABC transport system ATP-binding protein
MIDVQDLVFTYPRTDFELRIESLSVVRGEKLAVVGPSGSGKTTLLNLISGILLPDRGRITVEDQAISHLSDPLRRNFRAARVGFVFQQFELIEYLSVEENILLPLLVNKSLRVSSESKALAASLARSMGLSTKLRRTARRLSQGEQQRVAICRALIARPPLILADEPTGNLDPRNKHLTIELLSHYCQEHGATLVLVTHDVSLLGGFDRTLDFEDFRRESAA